MTRDEAWKMIGFFNENSYTRETGIGRTSTNGFIERLNVSFPDFHWRLICDRSGEYSRWAITIDDDDKREHYVPIGGRCIHCGKIAKELGVEERYDD